MIFGHLHFTHQKEQEIVPIYSLNKIYKVCGFRFWIFDIKLDMIQFVVIKRSSKSEVKRLRNLLKTKSETLAASEIIDIALVIQSSLEPTLVNVEDSTLTACVGNELKTFVLGHRSFHVRFEKSSV